MSLNRSEMNWWWYLLVIPALVVLLIAGVMGIFAWHYFNTRRLAYFGKTLPGRRRLKAKISTAAKIVRPLLRPLAGRVDDPNHFTISHEGIHAPANVCNAESFAAAVDFSPEENDVLVVTQMKCGTTWMLQMVYEILSQGRGDLSDEGHGHLHAVCPWLESFIGVPVADAPRIGDQGSRVIKTHLPAALCPFSDQAKYIYVTRHPASCFASCRDFFRSSAGEFTPSDEAMLDWFCSDAMWWGSWPDHTRGFLDLSQEHSNVLFIHFEEMKRDLPGSVDRVAAFLEVSLNDEQREAVIEKCRFSFMKENEELFEMLPPGLFGTGSTFFKSGALKRYEALSSKEHDRISDFCIDKLQGSSPEIETLL